MSLNYLITLSHFYIKIYIKIKVAKFTKPNKKDVWKQALRGQGRVLRLYLTNKWNFSYISIISWLWYIYDR